MIVYDIKHFSGDQVVKPFSGNIITRKGALEPNPDTPILNGLPPRHRPLNFATLDSKVARSGRDGFG
ncbi:AidA/PixA family protein, partial [Burkholderia pseudomallei]